MVKYYQSAMVFSIFFLSADANNKFKGQDDKNETNVVVNSHQQRFCNQSTSCSIVNLEPSEHRNLHYQNCMCDDQCFQYGDCCKDSGMSISKSNFTCVSIDEDDSCYMKTSCPSTWQGPPTTKFYCENAESLNNKSDIPLFIPVTSQNNFTYRNLFCALCNEDVIFDLWKVGIWVASNSNLTDPSIEKSTLLTDYINDISIKGIVPPHLVDKVRYCMPNVIDSCPPFWSGTKSCPEYTSYVYSGNRTFKNIECLLCNEENVTQTHDICKQSKVQPHILDFLFLEDSLESFPEANKFCNEIPEQNSAFQTLCMDSSDAETDDCSSPEMCHINIVLNISNGDDVRLLDNDTIYLKSHNLELKNGGEGTPEWIYLNETLIFVCGINVTTNSNEFLNYISLWLSDTLIKLSIICLILHLVAFQQLPKLRTTPGKSLAAYSFSLLIAFLCLDLDAKWGLCKFTAVILHYALLSCFAWMLLMSHNCWLSTYRATTKLRQTSDKKSNKFIWYTLIAFLVPLLIVSIGVYLELSSTKKVPCEWKPSYGTSGLCFIGPKKPFLALFIIPSSVLFMINNLFFAHTAYLIYFSQRRNTIKKQERIDFKLYIRLALIMGSTWIFGTLFTLTEWSIMQILFILLNMSQGIFIFIAFTLQKRNLKMLRSKYGENRRIAGIFNWCLGEEIVPNDTTTETLKLK